MQGLGAGIQRGVIDVFQVRFGERFQFRKDMLHNFRIRRFGIHEEALLVRRKLPGDVEDPPRRPPLFAVHDSLRARFSGSRRTVGWKYSGISEILPDNRKIDAGRIVFWITR